MTPEGRVKAKVKALLKQFQAYWHCPVQNGMGAPSLDFICCYYGHYFGIETKAGKQQPTARQWATIEAIDRAGGMTFVINEDTGTSQLEAWLTQVQRSENERAT